MAEIIVQITPEKLIKYDSLLRTGLGVGEIYLCCVSDDKDKSSRRANAVQRKRGDTVFSPW